LWLKAGSYIYPGGVYPSGEPTSLQNETQRKISASCSVSTAVSTCLLFFTVVTELTSIDFLLDRTTTYPLHPKFVLIGAGPVLSDVLDNQQLLKVSGPIRLLCRGVHRPDEKLPLTLVKLMVKMDIHHSDYRSRVGQTRPRIHQPTLQQTFQSPQELRRSGIELSGGCASTLII